MANDDPFQEIPAFSASRERSAMERTPNLLIYGELDRLLDGSQIAGDLLVQPARDHMSRDLALAIRSRSAQEL